MDVRDDVVDILAGFSLFADLSTPELENLVETFGEETFRDGERVLRQGLTGSNFYVILEGAATIRVDGTDRSTLRPGDYFGEISCLLGVPPVADIVAQDRLRCLVLPGDDLEAFLVSHPRVMYRLLQGEARKVRTTTRWLS
ncbi:MAG TPA: cyclic nucleotide-binding domain-containing protein [Candidatus Dormibacteraeota bacterium]|jgi:CRP-like cAMP-binding protein|nr:cyclic nucleotide-binding domain-containing protein [Candidatus Dormibacteraeota bacterium]